MDQMKNAERVVQEAAASAPPKLLQRLQSAEKLSDLDRDSILEMVRAALTRFQPIDRESEPKPTGES